MLTAGNQQEDLFNEYLTESDRNPTTLKPFKALSALILLKDPKTHLPNALNLQPTGSEFKAISDSEPPVSNYVETVLSRLRNSNRPAAEISSCLKSPEVLKTLNQEKMFNNISPPASSEFIISRTSQPSSNQNRENHVIPSSKTSSSLSSEGSTSNRMDIDTPASNSSLATTTRISDLLRQHDTIRNLIVKDTEKIAETEKALKNQREELVKKKSSLDAILAEITDEQLKLNELNDRLRTVGEQGSSQIESVGLNISPISTQSVPALRVIPSNPQENRAALDAIQKNIRQLMIIDLKGSPSQSTVEAVKEKLIIQLMSVLDCFTRMDNVDRQEEAMDLNIEPELIVQPRSASSSLPSSSSPPHPHIRPPVVSVLSDAQIRRNHSLTRASPLTKQPVLPNPLEQPTNSSQQFSYNRTDDLKSSMLSVTQPAISVNIPPLQARTPQLSLEVNTVASSHPSYSKRSREVEESTQNSKKRLSDDSPAPLVTSPFVNSLPLASSTEASSIGSDLEGEEIEEVGFTFSNPSMTIDVEVKQPSFKQPSLTSPIPTITSPFSSKLASVGIPGLKNTSAPSLPSLLRTPSTPVPVLQQEDGVDDSLYAIEKSPTPPPRSPSPIKVVSDEAAALREKLMQSRQNKKPAMEMMEEGEIEEIKEDTVDGSITTELTLRKQQQQIPLSSSFDTLASIGMTFGLDVDQETLARAQMLASLAGGNAFTPTTAQQQQHIGLSFFQQQQSNMGFFNINTQKQQHQTNTRSPVYPKPC